MKRKNLDSETDMQRRKRQRHKALEDEGRDWSDSFKAKDCQ